MIHSIAWLFIEGCTSLFDILIILTFLNGFLEKKDTTLMRKVIVFIIAFIQLFIVSSFLYNIPNALIVNFLGVSLFVSLFLYKGKFNTHMITCVLLLAILVVTELVTLCILLLSFEIEPGILQNNPIFKLIGITIKNILSFMAIKIICYFKKSYVVETKREYYFLLLMVPIICIFIALIILELMLGM